MPLTRVEYAQIRQALELMTSGANINGLSYVAKKNVESLLDNYTEDFVNSLMEDTELRFNARPVEHTDE